MTNSRCVAVLERLSVAFKDGMTVDLFALCFDANEPLRLAGFWAGVLGWALTDDPHDDGVALLPRDDTGFRIRFLYSQNVRSH